ncbi:hypothetical protein AB0D10_28470 [Kitasatospora sp. NPDC048545]|uniref:hypothetical protein n=1 Tax=Kitasatospora sp. NPDC048545 TaxID=3157208 RepID=UPI0033DB7017
MAARNNASWCEAMCQAHGRPGELSDLAWVNPQNNLAYYPNLVTLSPSVSGADVREALRGESQGAMSVKDSFASLDLLPDDYGILFEAEWIHRPAPAARAGCQWMRITDIDDLRQWEKARSGSEESSGEFPESLLRDDRVIIVGGFSGDRLESGAVLHISHGVAGVSNVFGPAGEAESSWAGLVSCAAREVPGVDLVGYERGAQLAAATANGFHSLGPLRVWQRNIHRECRKVDEPCVS